jgi:MscS family membrane protein
MYTRGLKRLILLAALLVPALHAQVPIPGVSQPAAPATKEESTEDPLGRNTPRGTVAGFMKAADKEDYDTAASYLETTQHGDVARELARQLQSVLDQETSIDLNKLSRRPEGSLTTTQNPNRDLVGVVTTPSGSTQIWLDRVPRGDKTPIWLFARSTLQQVPDIYEETSNTPTFERHMPSWARITIFSLPLWKFGVVLIWVPLILVFGSLFIRLFTRLLKVISTRLLHRRETGRVQDYVGPLRLILFGILFLITANYALSLLGRNFWRTSGTVLLVFGVTWMLMRIVGGISNLAVARLRRNQAFNKVALANLLGRLLQIAVLIIGVLVVLDLAGVNLTAALTGLGIGGLAIAFAAQKTLENLFGGIMIISDQPMRIGDFCKIGNVSGNVVDIGLRSTRIRTLDRTIVTIPNGQLATMNVENVALRDKFWFHFTISLMQQTTSDQMKAVLRQLRDLLKSHSNVESETARVRFINIATNSQDVEIYAYVFAPDYNTFLGIQEDLLLKVLDIVESAGTTLAIPMQVTHLVRNFQTEARPPEKKAVAPAEHP